MMRPSMRRNMYSNRRRRKGKNPLYTRFRCDPDPWNGSPPKTPPSSDDEANESEYTITSNVSLCSGLTRSSSETVAPAPIIKNNKKSYHYQCGARLNEVKRKLSKYVKMENANVLQSHQFTQKQMKLNVRKTAPVPLPFNINKKSVKSKQKQKQKHHNKQRGKQKPKQKQKQTAPAPKQPSYTLHEKIKEKKKKYASSNNVENKEKNKENIAEVSQEFKMRAFAEPFIPSSSEQKSPSTNDDTDCISSTDIDELIDFASIPEAFYVGNDNDIVYNLQKSKENIQNIQLQTTPTTTTTTTHSTTNDEILIYSPLSTADSVTNSDFVLTDFTNSDCSINKEKNHILLEEVHSDQENNNNDDELYFNDDKFALLAEKILEEPSYNMKHQYQIEYRPQYKHHHAPNINLHQATNIWAEPNPNAADAFPKHPRKQTLGGLLMNGLPPITTQLFH